jgi:hypothetical protein
MHSPAFPWPEANPLVQHFPPTADETDACFIVKDSNEQALA